MQVWSSSILLNLHYISSFTSLTKWKGASEKAWGKALQSPGCWLLCSSQLWSVKSSNQLYETRRKCQVRDSSMPCVYCHATVNSLGTVWGCFLAGLIYGFKNAFCSSWNIQRGKGRLLDFPLWWRTQRGCEVGGFGRWDFYPLCLSYSYTQDKALHSLSNRTRETQTLSGRNNF